MNLQDDTLDQLLIGSILGDGSFIKVNKPEHNSRLSIAHGPKQAEYAFWKHQILSYYNLAGKISKNKIVSDRYKDGFVTEYRFKSKAHSIFTSYRKMYYPCGIKTIVYENIKCLGDLGLAIWFMDDGYKHSVSYGLSACGFTQEDLHILVKVLKENFDLKATVHAKGIIYISASSREKFKSIVYPYILPSLRYKL
jgi:hypothetical protein